MTAEEMAAIHARAMTTPAPWGVPTFEGFLSFPGAIALAETDGFALGRVIADEAEVLTIAVLPEARRRGVGRRCLAAFEVEAARRSATRVFLEVAEDNTAARALYESFGYAEIARRADYYKTPDGQRHDALVMEKRLPGA